MFDAARLRLTGWYTLILGLVVAILSFALYHVLLTVQESELDSAHGRAGRAIARALAHDSVTLAYQIIAIDAGVLLLAAVGAYFLAGRTLRPIREVMERQRRFSSAASHELRTPLTALQGTLEVALLNRRSPEEYVEVLREAVEETERMGALVKDLTMLAQAERAVPLRLVPLDLVPLVGAVAADVGRLAERKCQSIEVDVPETLPIQGDPMKLRQAVTNLLENAVNYTPDRGQIHVVGKRERTRAILEIRDTGVGIARDHLAHLFEPFYQVDGARTAAGHVGLGLALTAWIVRAHHGQIDVFSREGVGTVFTLSLPLSP
jgi:two-component system, OmpR family, sensor kinase